MLTAAIHVSSNISLGELVVGGATVTLAIFALVQIAVERSARKHAERQSQASRVSAWPHSYWDAGDETVLILHNGSDEPVYLAVVSFVFIQGAAPRSGRELAANPELFGDFVRTFAVIPPGRHYTTVPSGWAGMMRRPGVELAFIDRSGVSWLRAADGRLSEIPREPVDYYGLSRPVGWDIPSDAMPSSMGGASGGDAAPAPPGPTDRAGLKGDAP